MNEQEAINELKEDIKLSMESRKLSGIEGKSSSVIAMEMAIKALEKQIPKKPTIEEFDYGEGYVCGKCESFLHYVDDDEEQIRINYCPACGQKLG